MTCTDCPKLTTEQIYSDETGELVGENYRCQKRDRVMGWKISLTSIDSRYRERVPVDCGERE